MRRVLELHFVLLLVGLTGSSAVRGGDDTWKATGSQAAVATGSVESADAALAVLQGGGNAVDAAVAAMLVLSVTDPQNFCFGGEVPLLVYDSGRKTVEVICGQGVAPRLATVAYFQQHHEGRIPASGHPVTAAVPGALDALLTSLDRYGTKTFAELAAPTLAILDQRSDGWQPQLASRIRRLIEAEQQGGGDRRRGLRLAADCFYRGPVARELDAWSRTHGGLIRYVDLATHVTRIEEPVAIDYRGYTIYKCGAWTQGPYLLEALRLLEKFDVRSLRHNTGPYIHLLTESLKLGLADRDTYYADPLFVRVPLDGLLSQEYADLRRPLIDLTRASFDLRPGDPPGKRALLGVAPADYLVPAEPVHDTTTCLVADRWGNVVAATPSGWGGVMAGETGILLGSRLRSLNTWSGHPNCIEPGKRPRITLTPTLVFRDGRPVAAISVAGGDQQDQVTLQLLLSRLEFGLDPARAVTAPRFVTDHLVGSFNQTPPQLGSLTLYETFAADAAADLRERGHHVTFKKPPLGHPVMLAIDPESGRKTAAGDPAARRHARAY
jgi:gamma-glutamyltranspeptidase/glutathione hydrolase